MGKYIYGKKEYDTFSHILKNDFHTFCFSYGVYLAYKDLNTSSLSFEEFFSQIKNCHNYNWHYVNLAHNKIREHLISAKIKISKNELRKMGYSGFNSVPRCPKQAAIIQQELFKFLDDEEFSQVYYSFLIEKWEENINNNTFLPCNTENMDTNCKNVFNNYIGFLRRVLLGSTKVSGKTIYHKLENHEIYKAISEEFSEEIN